MKLSEVKFLNPVTVKGALFHHINAEKRRFIVTFDPQFSVISVTDDHGAVTLSPFANVIWCKAVVEVKADEPKKK